MANPPVFWPGEFYGQRSLAGYSPWGRKESDKTEQLSFSLSQPWKVMSNLPNPGIEPRSPALQADSLPVWAPREAHQYSPGNYTQRPVINHSGKECEKGCIRMYNWITSSRHEHNVANQPYLNLKKSKIGSRDFHFQPKWCRGEQRKATKKPDKRHGPMVLGHHIAFS